VGTITAYAMSLFGAGLSVWYDSSAETRTMPLSSMPWRVCSSWASPADRMVP